MQDQEAEGAGGQTPPVFLVIDEPHETDPEVLRRRQELARAGYHGPGGGETLPGRWHRYDEDGPRSTELGPPTESYQESCDRYSWETFGGTRRHPYED